jgi:hypothetical protein
MTGEKSAGWRAVVQGPNEMGQGAPRHARTGSHGRASIRDALQRLLHPQFAEPALPHAAVKGSIAKLLRDLPHDAWTVLHDLPVGTRGRTIDHLVIGTSGIFAVRTRNHPGEKVVISGRGMWASGRPTDDLPVISADTRVAMTRLSEALGERIYVRPVLVLICAHLKIETQPTEVVALRHRELIRWFRNSAPAMALARSSTIARAAGKRSTWLEPQKPLGPPG